MDAIGRNALVHDASKDSTDDDLPLMAMSWVTPRWKAFYHGG